MLNAGSQVPCALKKLLNKFPPVGAGTKPIDPIKPLTIVPPVVVEFEEEVTDTLKFETLNIDSKELQEIKKMFALAEKDSELNHMLASQFYMFLERNTLHYHHKNKNNKLKFIAIECNDDDFEEVKQSINNILK